MHGEDADDHNLPKMLWLGVEPLVKENPAIALERASDEPHPAARAVHRAAGGRCRRARTARRRDRTRRRRTQISLLEGMRDGLEGRVDLTAPSSWAPSSNG